MGGCGVSLVIRSRVEGLEPSWCCVCVVKVLWGMAQVVTHHGRHLCSMTSETLGISWPTGPLISGANSHIDDSASKCQSLHQWYPRGVAVGRRLNRSYVCGKYSPRATVYVRNSKVLLHLTNKHIEVTAKHMPDPEVISVVSDNYVDTNKRKRWGFTFVMIEHNDSQSSRVVRKSMRVLEEISVPGWKCLASLSSLCDPTIMNYLLPSTYRKAVWTPYVVLGLFGAMPIPPLLWLIVLVQRRLSSGDLVGVSR
jgi:hypothetical protein